MFGFPEFECSNTTEMFGEAEKSQNVEVLVPRQNGIALTHLYVY
jgi:hypothetical protein